MFRSVFHCLPLFAAAALALAQAPEQNALRPDLFTVAERSEFTATARHAEVVKLLDDLAAAYPKHVRRVSLGTSHEGRDIPVLTVASPAIGTAEEAVKAGRAGKVVVLMLGNIHAGEVDGKEALPILAREILGAPETEPSPYLKDFVLIFAPIYNCDGNEQVDKNNRPGQLGPEEGMGRRENGQGLDLNRDFIKLEAPETRALVKFVNAWDPHIIIDTHTTNGSYHSYVLTHAGPRTLTGDGKLIEFTRGTVLPEVQKIAQEEYGRATFPYGDFNDDHTAWESFPSTARFLTSYFGLTNHITVLSEGYSYAPYQERVLATRDFCKAVLDYAAASKDAVRSAVSGAKERTTTAGREPKAEDMVAVRFKAVARPGKMNVMGFVEKQENGRTVPTDEHKDYECAIMDAFEGTLSVPRPFAYLLPPDAATTSTAAELLQRHGITVEELREDLDLETETYRIDSAETAERLFQGHAVRRVEATPLRETRRVAAGTILVRTAQPLGNLAIYCLEPACEDGLAAWNFFDDALRPGQDFPVWRVPAGTPILSTKVRPLAEDRKTGEKLTFETLYESEDAPNFNGSPIGGFQWLEDGEHYLQSRDGKLWKIHARTGRAEKFLDPAPMSTALAALPTIGEKRAKEWSERAGFSFTKDRAAAMFEHEGDLYYARLDGSLACRLTASPGEEELASFSPDGRWVAFVRANDLWVVDVATRTERQLTTGGTDLVRNGKADWVYFEEVFGRSWRTFWWSPDSQRLAFLRIDSSAEPRFVLTDDRHRGQVVENAPFPKPGDPNPRVAVGVVTAAGGEARMADLSGYSVEDMLVTSLAWRPDSSGVVFSAQNRIQSWADLMALPASGGAPKRLFRETTQAWVEMLGDIEFLKDGSFLFQSERDGWRHIYRYSRDGELQKRLTTGEWEVRGITRVDEDAGYVYFTGTRDSHIATNFYRVPLEGEEIERLTVEPGSHSASLAPKGALFADSWSSWDRTPRVVLREAQTPSAVVRTLDTNPVRDLERFDLGAVEMFQIKADNGEVYEASLCKPADFDPSRRYPVWFTTYGGPHSPTLSDSWSGGRTWDHMIAQSGIIVLRADGSTASGKGAVSAWPIYKKMGIEECADVERIIGWLKAQEWVDGDRIGMSGHSFGGYLTAFCMTHTDLFAAGIAGAPVTDWADYDSIYTERVMTTPQENPEGYASTSVTGAAKNLHGRLLLLHGMIDDNVHPQNTTRLVQALQIANKPFELMVYPGSRHGIGGKHYNRTVYEFMQRTLNGTGSRGAAWQPAVAKN